MLNGRKRLTPIFRKPVRRQRVEKVTTSEILKQEGMRELEKPAKYVCIVDGCVYFFSREDIEKLKPQEAADLLLKLKNEKEQRTTAHDDWINRLLKKLRLIKIACAAGVIMSLFSLISSIMRLWQV